MELNGKIGARILYNMEWLATEVVDVCACGSTVFMLYETGTISLSACRCMYVNTLTHTHTYTFTIVSTIPECVIIVFMC